MRIYWDITMFFSAAFVFSAALGRLNDLYAARDPLKLWRVPEVAGLGLVLAAAAGCVGELFLPRSELVYAKDLLLLGCALTVVGRAIREEAGAIAREMEIRRHLASPPPGAMTEEDEAGHAH